MLQRKIYPESHMSRLPPVTTRQANLKNR